MSEDNLTDAQREAIESEKEKFRKEVGKGSEVVVRVESETQFEQQKLWDEMRQTLVSEYERRSLPFDANSIKTKEQIESEFAKLQKMKADEERIASLEKHVPSGVPLTGRQMGEPEDTSSERPTEFLKKLAEDIPIDMMNFVSEKEMIRFLENASRDTNFEQQKECEKMYARILSHTFQRTGSVEFSGEGKDFGKREGKWRKKKTGDD